MRTHAQHANTQDADLGTDPFAKFKQTDFTSLIAKIKVEDAQQLKQLKEAAEESQTPWYLSIYLSVDISLTRIIPHHTHTHTYTHTHTHTHTHTDNIERHR